MSPAVAAMKIPMSDFGKVAVFSVGEADTVPRSGRCGSAEADTERSSRLRENSGNADD